MRLAVLGSPIAHSKSPALHAAAYRALGLEWSYEAIEMDGAGLPEFVGSLDEHWRGLSLTMPLKRDILPLLTEQDPVATLTGAANTVLIGRDSMRGFNTDVAGIAEAFREAGFAALKTAEVLGGGATAASAIVALSQLGVHSVVVSVRDASRASALVVMGNTLGIDVTVRALQEPRSHSAAPDAIVSTLPGHSEHTLVFTEEVRRASVLFDVAYDPWPSRLAVQWESVGGTVISGIEMLVLQALAQVRIFVLDDPDAPLDNEADVLAAMRAAVSA